MECWRNPTPMPRCAAIVFLLLSLSGSAATRLHVTVIDEKTLEPDLKASDCELLDDKTRRPIAEVKYGSEGLLDVMLLVDASLLGEAVKPVAGAFIEQLGEREQMAIVSFDSSANLLQDFTADREALLRALSSIRYGNAPRVLDAMFATLEGGFSQSAFRRVMVVVTAGVEGGSRVRERDIVQLALKAGVSVYPVFVSGDGKWLFRDIVEQTGGAFFRLQELAKRSKENPAARIFDVIRNRYTLTLQGNPMLSEKLKLKINRPGKYLVGMALQQ